LAWENILFGNDTGSVRGWGEGWWWSSGVVGGMLFEIQNKMVLHLNFLVRHI
jgi:hypothetical protein